VSAYIYIEGGGDSKELHVRCREAFRRLLDRCGFTGRMPRLVACGGRAATFDDFTTAHHQAVQGDYVAMLVDSEDPVADIDQTWVHLKQRDNWSKPAGVNDEQVLLMATCTETWIVADRQTLREHYGQCLQEAALPPLVDLESRHRGAVQDALVQATRNCKNPYAKGKRCFEVVAKLDPDVLKSLLPSFKRFHRVLGTKL